VSKFKIAFAVVLGALIGGSVAVAAQDYDTSFVGRIVAKQSSSDTPTCASSSQGGICASGDLEAEDDLFVADDATIGGDIALTGSITAANLTATAGLYPDAVTADPCGTLTVGAIFYNSTSNYHCYCNGAGADIKMNDNTTACF